MMFHLFSYRRLKTFELLPFKTAQCTNCMCKVNFKKCKEFVHDHCFEYVKALYIIVTSEKDYYYIS